MCSQDPSDHQASHADCASNRIVERFRQSMVMNYERWHDGVGYDMSLLQTATPQEREEIEALLLSKGVDDWRDVEALAVIDSARTRARLRQTFERGPDRLKIALVAHSGNCLTEAERTQVLVQALANPARFGGLTHAMLQVETHHPPEVIKALWQGAERNSEATAAEFAAMLLYLHGKAESPYALEERAFLLRFQDEPREPLLQELAARIARNAP